MPFISYQVGAPYYTTAFTIRVANYKDRKSAELGHRCANSYRFPGAQPISFSMASLDLLESKE
jgi:hypothetical protein